MKVKIKRFDKTLPLPEYDESNPITGKSYDKSEVAGFDLLCREDAVIGPRELGIVGVNNAIKTPLDCFLLISLRSSTPWKKGLMLANGVGIIDPFFSGDDDELKIQLYNITDKPVEVKKGEALAQGIMVKRVPVEWDEVQSMDTSGHGGYKT